MTAFITLCLKNARLDLRALLLGMCLGWSACGPVSAESVVPDISSLKFERSTDAVLLSANVRFELSTVIEEALLKGVPMIFVAELELFRERWYWTNKRVASAERHMRLAYQPLTRRWRLNVASGTITNAALAVALNQNFDALPDALAAVQRLSRWKVADLADLDLEQQHLVVFRFRLDTSQLPRPFQIGTLGQADWNIDYLIRQPLSLEPLK
jgi:hypothetical protein